jgi:exonuclease SbcC
LIPINLRISGFLSYNQPVEVNFESFDLACITGANGAGKSSLLDALTWVLFGEARRRDDSIINHQSKAAEVRFDFEYESAIYRIQRSKARDKSAVLEFSIRNSDGQWKPLTEPTLRGTEEMIRQTLHLDYETFVNTSFFLQGKADLFTEQKPGDRKRILASILGLDVWESYKDEAALRRRNHELDLENVKGSISEIEGELLQEAERKARLAQVEAEHANLSRLLEAKKTVLDQQRVLQDRVKSEQRTLEKQAAELDMRQRELESMQSRLAARQTERSQHQLLIEREPQIRAEYQAWQDARSELEKWEALAVNFHQFEQQRSAPLLRIETERSRLMLELKNLERQQEVVNNKQAALPGLQAEYSSMLDTVSTLTARSNIRPQLEEGLRAVQGQKALAVAANQSLRPQMDELKERIARLGEATGSACPVCGKPLEEHDRESLIGELNEKGKEMGNTFRENVALLNSCDSQTREIEAELRTLQRVEADLKLQQRLLDGKRLEMEGVQREIADWQKIGLPDMGALQNKIANEDFAAEDRAALSLVDEKLKALGYDAAAHEARRKAEASLRSSQAQMVELEKARSALVPLQREITELTQTVQSSQQNLQQARQEHAAAQAKLLEDTRGLPDLSSLEKEYYDLQEQSNQVLRNVGYARNQVDVLEKQRLRLVDLKAERDEINLQIANLKTLEKAFGKDGIPALLIEQALPEIEAHANEILDRLSSGEMSISFVTQRQFKDKKREDRKETLDIVIQDAAGSREYELFSGGEAFRINFAIRLALSQVLARRAGARLQTLVIDEGFGSQDADGRQRLVEAINLVKSEFAKIMVITHLEELKDAFPARIEVTKLPRGSQVEVLVA